jgi:hypothetical protein
LQQCTQYPVSSLNSLHQGGLPIWRQITSNKQQCIKPWERHTDWNGRRHSWASWPLYSQSPSISSIGMDLRFGKVPRSRSLWLPTGRMKEGCYRGGENASLQFSTHNLFHSSVSYRGQNRMGNTDSLSGMPVSYLF